jgi:hypothetical protein
VSGETTTTATATVLAADLSEEKRKTEEGQRDAELGAGADEAAVRRADRQGPRDEGGDSRTGGSGARYLESFGVFRVFFFLNTGQT